MESNRGGNFGIGYELLDSVRSEMARLRRQHQEDKKSASLSVGILAAAHAQNYGQKA